MTYIYVSDDGQLLALNPSDYCWVPKVEDLEAGIYEPQFAGQINNDGNYEMRITQTMMPLIRLR